MNRLFSQWLRKCVTPWYRRSDLVLPAATRDACTHSAAPSVGTVANMAQPVARTCVAPRVHAARTPSTRIIEWETAANGSARTLGRVVMVGKFSEICAELDRLAALEMA